MSKFELSCNSSDSNLKSSTQVPWIKNLDTMIIQTSQQKIKNNALKNTPLDARRSSTSILCQVETTNRFLNMYWRSSSFLSTTSASTTDCSNRKTFLSLSWFSSLTTNVPWSSSLPWALMRPWSFELYRCLL